MPERRLPPRWTPPIAASQAGVFTVRQALSAGASRDTVRYRRRSGSWLRAAGDGFVLVGTVMSTELRVVAAGLTWPDAVVCLEAAARVHRLPVPEPDEIDVIVPNRRAGRRGLRSHVVPVTSAEVVRHGPALVTDLRRTLVDCIGRCSPEVSDGLVAWSVAHGVLDAQTLAAAVAARPGSWGNARRRRALVLLSSGAASVGELRLHRLLRPLKGWQANVPIRVDGRIVAVADVLFDALRLVIELDGRRFHGGDRFQADRDRDNALVGAGYSVLRFTWHDVVERPAQTLAVVEATLARLRG